MSNPQPGVNPSCHFTVDPVAAGPGVCAWIAEAQGSDQTSASGWSLGQLLSRIAWGVADTWPSSSRSIVSFLTSRAVQASSGAAEGLFPPAIQPQVSRLRRWSLTAIPKISGSNGERMRLQRESASHASRQKSTTCGSSKCHHGSKSSSWSGTVTHICAGRSPCLRGCWRVAILDRCSSTLSVDIAKTC